MLKYFKTAPPAARIEFAAAGLWIVAALAGALWTGAYLAVHQDSRVIQAIVTLIALGAIGALPSWGVGAILYTQQRSRIWTGAIIAIVLAVVYVAAVAQITIESLTWAASTPGASPDMDFLVIGVAVVVAGLMHASSGVVAIRGLQRTGRVSGPRAAGA